VNDALNAFATGVLALLVSVVALIVGLALLVYAVFVCVWSLYAAASRRAEAAVVYLLPKVLWIAAAGCFLIGSAIIASHCH
jgi:hypothetical protein